MEAGHVAGRAGKLEGKNRVPNSIDCCIGVVSFGTIDLFVDGTDG